jgi:hypothetical protein
MASSSWGNWPPFCGGSSPRPPTWPFPHDRRPRSGFAPPDEETLNRAYQIITREVGRAELLTGYKGNAFSITEKSEEDLLRITAAHPMTADAVETLLRRNGDKWATIDHLVRERRLVEPYCEGHRYYLRRLQ